MMNKLHGIIFAYLSMMPSSFSLNDTFRSTI